MNARPRPLLRPIAALLSLLFVATPLLAADTPLEKLGNARRIVFLGDSITYAGQYVEAIEAYCVTRFPDRELEFINAGLSSETVSGASEPGHAGGRYPRPHLHQRLDRILEKIRPDLIFACYGMNDGIYHPPSTERLEAFQNGIRLLREKAARGNARIIHITPPTFDPVPIPHKTTNSPPFSFSRPYPNYDQTLGAFSGWLLSQRAAGWEVIDLHGPMTREVARQRQRNPGFTFAPDGVHPNDSGHWFMAREILLHLGAGEVAEFSSPSAMVAAIPAGAELLKLVRDKQQLLRDAWLMEIGHTRPGVKEGLPLAEAQSAAADLDRQIRQLSRPKSESGSGPRPFPGTKSTWQGFDRFDFEVEGKAAIVVVPRNPLPGNPWIWRGEFFNAFPNADVALVDKGFHLAYLRVQNLFGNDEAVRHWNRFYEVLTTQHGLARKPALIGLSRGALYCYNWAAANPEKVACIYADAPVCDLKSWPGGQPQGLGTGKGSATEWEKMLIACGFQNREDVVAFRGNPIDRLQPLADAGIPLLHVYGDADVVTPWEENTKVLADRYRQLGGNITLISKPGVGHHPHGLTDPTPIVEFILKHAASAQ